MSVTRSSPPPGLRRMVLGQIEQNTSRGTNLRTDEPPPGLSRMVLGQTENAFLTTNQSSDDIRQAFDPMEPPEGLHRMVPGESSSPELASRSHHPNTLQEDEFEVELSQISSHMDEPRSATIGADTPPSLLNIVSTPTLVSTTNRSETIGADTPPMIRNTQDDRTTSLNILSNSRVSAIGVAASERKKKDDLPKKLEQMQKINNEHNPRDPVEGQIQDTIGSLVTSIRNLTVGENSLDNVLASNVTDQSQKVGSRRESTDSDPELRASSPRDHYERRYRNKDDRHKMEDKKEREDRHENDLRNMSRHERGRHTPDLYRDKKYSSRGKLNDRRYDDDTDYYSDKERDRQTRSDKDYDRVYYSLRKDKDRKRRDGRDSRRGERDYRRNEYYTRYEVDYLNDSRSRPSSRSDSLDESYRERGHYRDHMHHDREHRHERERRRRHRDPFAPYSQGFGYDTYGQYYQQYQYYEALRRTNPQAYAELYRKYYQQTRSQGPFGSEDRASVHSGRSSANEEILNDRYLNNLNQTGSTVNAEDSNLTDQRLTPGKFTTAHMKSTICSGRLVRVPPNYPLDGQLALVEIYNLSTLLVNDEEYKELAFFPGPFSKGVTHKKTIIEYCEGKIKSAMYNSNVVDVESYVLLWELLILLIRQNGMVVGTDIAELLLKNRQAETHQRPSSVMSSTSSNAAEINISSEASNQHMSEATNSSVMSILKEDEVTNKFREYLLYGSCMEALEWAMKHGLWGHALFLATKLDKRTYANVMMRFGNGLTLNDPLQTLYQLLSGRTPACVTCVADEKWGDWRPHLAMILSNTSQRPELNCKAVTIMGDTLMSRGSLYAAQFCYLMAEVGFGNYASESAKLVLLGSDHNKSFEQFATNEAIHMTEIYEYACSLNDAAFMIPEFQVYKYLSANRLADYGLLEKSLTYLEKVAIHLVNNPSVSYLNLVNNVSALADKLKYQDIIGDVEYTEFDENVPANRPDNSWLRDLKNLYENYNVDLLSYQNKNTDVNEHAHQIQQAAAEPLNILQDVWQQQQTLEQYQQLEQPWPDKKEDFKQSTEYPHPVEQDAYGSAYQSQELYSENQSQWQNSNQYGQEAVHQEVQQQSYDGLRAHTEDVRPHISLPNQSKIGSPYNDVSSPAETEPEDSSEKTKPEPLQPEKPKSSGWFGGIFSRLAPKPKNQMKLPDDKNPTIVWDPVKKRWINNDEDSSSNAGQVQPPPKMLDFISKVQQTNQISGEIPPVPVMAVPGEIANSLALDDNIKKSPQANIFKLQGRGRNLKKSYVDIFNPTVGKSIPQVPVAGSELRNLHNTQPVNFFIPQPVHDPNAPVHFLTSAPLHTDDNSDINTMQFQ